MSKTANQNDVVVTLPDGTTRRFLGEVTAGEVAADIGPGLAKAALAARIPDQQLQLGRYVGAGIGGGGSVMRQSSEKGVQRTARFPTASGGLRAKEWQDL